MKHSPYHICIHFRSNHVDPHTSLLDARFFAMAVSKCPAPIGVTIASGGVEDLKWFKNRMEEDGYNLALWEITDLREDLRRDPAHSVNFQEE